MFHTILNKKVLLRERKRHTARRVASTRYAVGGGGVPTLGGGRVSTFPGGGGVPTLGRGYLPSRGGPTFLAKVGTPLSRPGKVGTPPPTQKVGTPPPRCGQTDTCENSTFPRTTYAGSNNFDFCTVEPPPPETPPLKKRNSTRFGLMHVHTENFLNMIKMHFRRF